MGSDLASKTSSMGACRHLQYPPQTMIATQKAFAATDDQARVWGGRGATSVRATNATAQLKCQFKIRSKWWL